MSPITVEKPAEYAAASVDFQQAFDSVVSNVVSLVSPDDTTPQDGVSPLSLFSATTPDAQPKNNPPPKDNPPPKEAAPSPIPGSKRQFTAEEAAELKALVELQNQFRAAIAGLKTGRAEWERTLAEQTVTQNVLKDQLAKARTELKAAEDALKAYDDGKPNDPPSTRQALAAAVERAKGVVSGMEKSVAAVQTLMSNIQQRIDYLNSWITHYEAQVKAISDRIAAIVAAAFNDQPSGAAPKFELKPFPQMPAAFFDWKNPLPAPGAPGAVAPQPQPAPKPPSSDAPPTTNPPPATPPKKDSPEDNVGSDDTAQSPSALPPVVLHDDDDLLIPITV
jgi:hypothetical protein